MQTFRICNSVFVQYSACVKQHYFSYLDFLKYQILHNYVFFNFENFPQHKFLISFFQLQYDFLNMCLGSLSSGLIYLFDGLDSMSIFRNSSFGNLDKNTFTFFLVIYTFCQDV